MSLAQTGNYVALISFLLGLFKVNIATEEVSKIVEAITVVIGICISWYGRYRQGDLTVLGARK